jgi:heterodisulfide reductase subunit A
VEKEPAEMEDQTRNRLADRIRKSLADRNFGDVLVVGGGISGIQAALDLGTAGFKVYLVEKAPSIGGHMAQLDKTFPTNDCSM